MASIARWSEGTGHMKELNVCEDNGKTTIELHPITVRAVKVEEIRKVKTSDKKKKNPRVKE